MTSISLKKRLLIILGLITLVLILISVFIVYPTIKKINELREGVTQIENDLEQKYENSQKLRRTMRELESIKEQTQNFEKTTIKVGDELKIITELENIATKNNIDQTLNVNFHDSTQETKGKQNNTKITSLPDYYELSFINNGFFVDHINYLKDIEFLSYYVIIDNVHFEKRKGEENTIDPITLNFSAIIYAETKN